MEGHHEALCENVRLAICRRLAEGGYMERVRRAGPELARWHDYLVDISRPGRVHIADPMVQPTIFPMMEDLQGPAWVHARDFPASAILERSMETIRGEIEALDAERYLRYPSVILGAGNWTVMPVFAFGAAAGTLMYRQNPFPETMRIIRTLPDACPELPLADYVFSAHAPGTHLLPHCSWDPFRTRLHLGLRIPGKCAIRVGNETRHWEEGKVIAFHDSCEHETWNESNARRVVLIVDLWHRALTHAERRAILACFCKTEVRTMMMKTRATKSIQPYFETRFAAAEANDPLIAEFWDR